MGSDMTPIIPGSPSGARSPQDSANTSGLGVEEYQWLVSPAAARWLDIAADTDEKSLVRMSLTLRKDLGVTRTHLVIAQAELRRRAGIKFKHASRMFFTRQLLEQATDDQIAGYKARRWPADGRLARPVLRHRRRFAGVGPARTCGRHRSRSSGGGLVHGELPVGGADECGRAIGGCLRARRRQVRGLARGPGPADRRQAADAGRVPHAGPGRPRAAAGPETIARR